MILQSVDRDGEASRQISVPIIKKLRSFHLPIQVLLYKISGDVLIAEKKSKR